MIKPPKLRRGDTIATVSPSWGCAGAPRVKWQYELGCRRLRELGLNVVAAPNSMKGTAYLRDHPEARAEDIQWAFENADIRAIIANIGGNDSERLLPHLSADGIRSHPKILCGYSDVMSLHLYCHRLGLMTFYGDNVLTNVAEGGGWHPYSRYWFEKAFFDDAPIGLIPPSAEWSCDENRHTDRAYRKRYVPNAGCRRVQGRGAARGRLFGGHGEMRRVRDGDGKLLVDRSDFEGSIFFFEDIPEVCDAGYMADFFDWLGQNGYLQALNGIIIGKMRARGDFGPYAEAVRNVISGKYGLSDLPVMSDMNFGHSSPVFVLPYGAEAEMNVDELSFRILESGVV